MRSLDIGHVLRRCLTLGLGTAVCCAAAPQPTLDTAAEIEREALSERLRAAQVEGGPYAKELIEPLTSLVSLYDESGNHDLAAAVTEQALQVIRANYGLRSLDQAPLLQQRIRTEQGRGNAAAAWELEQELLRLARAHRGDLRAAAIFREVGDKRLDLLRRYAVGEPAPEVQLGCFYRVYRVETGLLDNCSSGSRRAAIAGILKSAQRYYADAINVFRDAELYSSEELRALEMALIRSAYLHGTGDYQIGRESYGRLLAYDVASGASLRARLDALVQLGDWDLLYEQRPAALGVYRATYEFLQRQALDQSSIDALFSPSVPVALPAFLSSPLVSSSSPGAEHVDVAFDISRYGSSGRVEVLDASPGVSKDARRRLVQTIERTRFRPRFVGGDLPRETRVVVRYYVND